jgi:hypothetical protein
MAGIKEVEVLVEPDYDPEYIRDAVAAGFTEAQAKFLHDTFAFDPHEHTPDQILLDDGETLDGFIESFSEAD